MQRSIVLGLALLGATSPACRPSGGVEEPATPESGTKAHETAPSLAEIAKAIDPGPRAALTMEVPAWLSAALGLPGAGGDPAGLLAASREQWARFEAASEGEGDAAKLDKLVSLARALALAERAGGNIEQAPVEVLLVLERIYHLVDAPALANDRNVFAQMIQGFVAALASTGELQDSAALDELAGLVFGALRKSGDLQRRTVAALLRRAPEHPEIPDVLGRLAPKLMDGDEALALGVMHRSLAMRGESATAAHWLDLVGLCSRALDVRCGRDALGRAEALAPADDAKLQVRLTGAREQAKRAQRAVELKDAAGLEDQLEHGRALAELERHEEARAVFEALMRRHPEDARPVAGLARVVLSQSVDFVGAAQVLERAQPREHLDREWYELSIGVRATSLIYHVLPRIADRDPDEIFAMLRPMLLQMQQDIDALEALGVDDGRVLRFVHDLGMEAWPKARAEDGEALRELARGALSRTRTLQAEVPNNIHAYTLMLAAAEFSSDREQALAVLDIPPPAEHAEALAMRRGLGALDLVASWDADERVGTMLALVEAAGGASQPLAARRQAVDGQLLARRLGKGDLGLPELERRYRGLLDEAGGPSDAVLLNNLAVVVAEQGRTDDALALWARAIEQAQEDARDLPRLNAVVARLAASGGRAEPTALEREELERLAQSGGAVEVRLQALAWLAATAGAAERRKADKRLHEVAVKEASTNYRSNNLPGRGGVILRGTVQVGLGYSTVEGLQIQLDTSGVPWFVLPCPVVIPASPGWAP